MKTIVSGLLVLVFATAATTAAVAQTATTRPLAANTQVTVATYTPKAGDVLTYHVTTPGKQYDFTVTLKTFRPGIAFDWVMSGDVNQKGAITFNNTDAADAMVVNNFFNPGAVELTGKTSVWLSNTAYKLLKSNATANLTFDNSAIADALKNCGSANYKVSFNGQQSELGYIKANNGTNCVGTKELWVLDNPLNPLIIYMNLGWTIQLTSIKQQ